MTNYMQFIFLFWCIIYADIFPKVYSLNCTVCLPDSSKANSSSSSKSKAEELQSSIKSTFSDKSSSSFEFCHNLTLNFLRYNIMCPTSLGSTVSCVKVYNDDWVAKTCRATPRSNVTNGCLNENGFQTCYCNNTHYCNGGNHLSKTSWIPTLVLLAAISFLRM